MYRIKGTVGLFLIFILSSCETKTAAESEMNTNTSEQTVFDWQGHRGARGLVAENTIPAFLKALSYPIQTLELDVVITRDSQVLVSHDPWMSAKICTQPDGTEITGENEKQFIILEMDYATIQGFNCGLKHSGFPGQEPITVSKPLLTEVIDAVEKYCQENNRALPQYNIEIKSNPAWDNTLTPAPAVFAKLLLDLIEAKGIQARTTVQSFDIRSIEAVHQLNPTISQAYLVETAGNVQTKLGLLSFQPEIYSPHFELLNKSIVDTLHEKGMKVIPWTVNETKQMQKLITMGVDGIITDYPNRIPFDDK
jgi:glycerophosphoryl diester phosphodiesterase